jgi:hypothetical protein
MICVAAQAESAGKAELATSASAKMAAMLLNKGGNQEDFLSL